MGQPAVVMNDQITGTCLSHLLVGPNNAPVPAPGLPFTAPLLQGLTTTVTIGGKPAAVMGSSGTNTTPHGVLHASDPYMAPPTQVGRVTAASSTVFFDGKPAAYTGCTVTICASAPGQIMGSAATVLVGS